MLCYTTESLKLPNSHGIFFHKNTLITVTNKIESKVLINYSFKLLKVINQFFEFSHLLSPHIALRDRTAVSITYQGEQSQNCLK